MKIDAFAELFNKHEDEFLKFDRVAYKRSGRPDLNAFMLLDEILPGDRDIISSAEHDEYWLSIEPGVLAGVVTEGQVVDLIRCGVRYDSSFDSLAVFA